MAIITLSANEVFKYDWPKDADWTFQPNEIKSTNLIKFNTEDTYIFIFCKEAAGNKFYTLCMDFLKKMQGINILHISPMAVNRVPYHGQNPRNYVVIVEFNDPSPPPDGAIPVGSD
jgi:hypothetical protein